MGEIKLEEIAEIEKGAEGVRVTWKAGERKFIQGEIGFELYRRWMEAGDERER